MCIILHYIYVADHTDAYKYVSFFSFLILIIVTNKSVI